jgi:hypothetical protein
MPGRRLWDSLLLPYCCQAFDHSTGAFYLFAGFAGKTKSRRADSNRFTAHYELEGGLRGFWHPVGSGIYKVHLYREVASGPIRAALPEVAVTKSSQEP